MGLLVSLALSSSPPPGRERVTDVGRRGEEDTLLETSQTTPFYARLSNTGFEEMTIRSCDDEPRVEESWPRDNPPSPAARHQNSLLPFFRIQHCIVRVGGGSFMGPSGNLPFPPSCQHPCCVPSPAAEVKKVQSLLKDPQTNSSHAELCNFCVGAMEVGTYDDEPRV